MLDSMKIGDHDSYRAGLAFGTLGSDTGGSIRFLSAANGVVGLKPTWGRVSRYGILALAESLDHVGPLTRSTVDAAVMLQAIAGHDPNDPTSLPGSAPELLGDIAAGIGGLRIGFDVAYVAKHASSEMASAVTTGVRLLESLEATIVEVQLPDLDAFLPAWPTLSSAEAVVAHKMTYPEQRDRYGPWFRDWLDLGATVTGQEYAEANHMRAACTGQLRTIFAEIDVLACPSMNGAAQPITRVEMYGSLGDFHS
jgi:amidase